MNAFESTADITGLAVPVSEIKVAGHLADGVWPVICNWQAPAGVAGAMAAAATGTLESPNLLTAS